MKIAHLVSYTARYPLAKHHGRHDWALQLAQIQASAGHEVTVYAGAGSKDDSQIIWQSLDYDFGNSKLNNLALIKSAFQADDYDIYHSHFDYLHYFVADTAKKPIIATQHWFPDESTARAVHFNTANNVLAVPPTNYMARQNKQLGIPSAETIHHGIDLKLFKFNPQPPGDRLIFVGRICARKGVAEAVKIARLAGQKLDIIGKLNEVDKPYWQKIEPLVDDDQICYLGPKSQPEVAKLFAKAKAFIFPSQAEEAFGLATIEAQACGAPVIINGVGASSELVDNGKSGFVVNSETEYLEAIKNIGRIDRRYCRQFAEQFSLDKMVDSYDHLYRKLINKTSA